MKALVCEKCGGPLKLKPDTSIAVCDFCGTEYYLGADEKEIEKRLEAESLKSSVVLSYSSIHVVLHFPTAQIYERDE